jgi:hypothetical protein
MAHADSLETLAAEVARVHARLDEQARLRLEAETRLVHLLAEPVTSEERRATFTVIAGSARRRTARRGRLRSVPRR